MTPHRNKDFLKHNLSGLLDLTIPSFPIFSSFRAAQKLNLSSKRKKHQPSLLHPQEPSIYPTNFSGILQVSPPPTPPCLLRAVSKVKENPGMGKVRTCTEKHIFLLIMHTDVTLSSSTSHTHTQMHRETPVWRGEMQSGDRLVYRQHAVWSSSCRFSLISLLECHEFTQFVGPAFLSQHREPVKAVIHISVVTTTAGFLNPFYMWCRVMKVGLAAIGQSLNKAVQTSRSSFEVYWVLFVWADVLYL